MKKQFLIFTILTLVFILSACGSETTKNKDAKNNEQKSEALDVIPKGRFSVGDPDQFSLSDIAAHASSTDCWMAVDKTVYNVTVFISSHPGGEAITQGCGKDATELFKTRPMGSGTPHSEKAESILEKYNIGELK